MDGFPKEILSNIFILLHQIDKVECMTVCRYWKETIQQTNLFETVYITSMHQLERLVKILEQDARFGSQTNRLIIETDIFCEREMTNLPKVFPKVRTFYLNSPHVETNKNITMDFRIWRNHFESISESQNDFLTTHLLASGVCDRLISISLYKLKSVSFRGFIELLGNAPSLKSLEVAHLVFTFHDLERIHTVTPGLKRISMNSVYLEGQQLPDNIEPARCITSTSFNIINGWDMQTEILEYIRTKYINLEECILANSSNQMIPDDQRDSKSYGLVPLFQVLGKKLKILNIRFTHTPPRLFHHLDNASCQIESLILDVTWSSTILSHLSKSNQAQFLQSLNLNRVDFYDFCFLKELPALKELFLTSRLTRLEADKQKETNLNYILDSCSNRLQLLYLHGFRLSCTFARSCVYPVKNLILKCVVLPSNNFIDYFIAIAFPQLQILKLNSCELDKYNGGCFRLPFHNLSYLEIEEKFKEDNDYILITTTKSIEKEQYQNQHQHQNQGHQQNQKHQQQNQIYQPIKNYPYRQSSRFPVTREYKDSLPFRFVEYNPILTFECASVRTLALFRS